MADVAHVLHFGAGELLDMDDTELRAWHDQACRILEAQQALQQGPR